MPYLRDELKGRILSLSEDWKSTQARGTKRSSEEQSATSDREVEGLIGTGTSSEKTSPVEKAESDDEPVLLASVTTSSSVINPGSTR